jgi:hypothetical protein
MRDTKVKEQQLDLIRLTGEFTAQVQLEAISVNSNTTWRELRYPEQYRRNRLDGSGKPLRPASVSFSRRCRQGEWRTARTRILKMCRAASRNHSWAALAVDLAECKNA